MVFIKSLIIDSILKYILYKTNHFFIFFVLPIAKEKCIILQESSGHGECREDGLVFRICFSQARDFVAEENHFTQLEVPSFLED